MRGGWWQGPTRRTAVAGAGAAVMLAAACAVPGAVEAHGPVPPPPTWPDLLWAWMLDPLPVIGVLVAAIGYGWLARRVRRRHPRNPVPRLRHWAWAGGLLAIVAALLSPIETYSGALLTVHMVQHLLLQFVAAPLLLLAAPVTLLLRAVDQDSRRRFLVILHSRLVTVITFPLLTWFLFAAANWGWHFSELYDYALEVQWVHVLQHATLLGAALLFWFPVIGADPGPWRLPHAVRLLYLFLAMPQNSFLGVAIMNAGVVLYSHYAALARDWGPVPLLDQQAAGTLMWVWGDLTFVLAMLLAVAAWVRQEERRNARAEARQDALEAEAGP
ncbi:MAG: cytochrome c oxidase assembly protein [Candidatus Limnocylindria bacterium]